MSPHTQKALDIWLSTDSWASGHSLDDGRFNKFFWNAFHFDGGTVGSSDVEKAIRAVWAGRLDDETLNFNISNFRDRFVTFTELAETGQGLGFVK